MYNFSLEMFMSVFKTTVYSLGNSYLTPDQEDTVLEFNFNTANRDRQLDFKVDKHVASLVDHITMNLHKQVGSFICNNSGVCLTQLCFCLSDENTYQVWSLYSFFLSSLQRMSTVPNKKLILRY